MMMKSLTALQLIGTVLLAVLPSAATAGDPSAIAKARQEVVQSMAAELRLGLNPPPGTAADKSGSLAARIKESAWELKQWWRDETAPAPKKRKIAIWPFWHEESVVSESFAKILSDSLLAELVRGKAPGDEYVARHELKAVIQDIDDFNHLRQSSEKIGKLIRSAGADILIVGEVRPDTDGRAVHIRYQATDVATGGIPAATDWYRLAYDFDRTPTMSAAEAISRSARHFRERLPAMQTVRPQGIRFGDTGIRTPFGKWFSARLTDALRKDADQAGRPIRIDEALLTDETVRTRGLKLAQKSADAAMAAAPTGDYVLSGRYWQLGEKVDLQLTLKDGDGRAESWQGYIRITSIDLPVEPANVYPTERETDNLGPISLLIRSNRGADPVYRTGQKMVLFVEASQDSYLYCFYRQANGTVMRVFPNRFHRDALIPGGRTQHIPSAAMDFDWIVEPPTGVEIMKCYAFDRDVAEDLPPSVRAADFTPLPFRSLADLGLKLRAIPGVGIAENSMVVNVED